MIGFVVVSHSEALAEAAVDLAMQMIHGEAPPVRIASGADGGFGTDAAAIADAIDALADTDGVLIITDLGSAVLSSELALDLRTSTVPVRISDGPFVEGITAGLVRAATGGGLHEVATEVSSALAAKQAHAPAASMDAPTPGAASTAAADAAAGDVSVDAVLRNPMGLHSRPAALVVKTVGGFDADVSIANVTTGAGPASARSMIGLLALGAGGGATVRISASGPDAAAAVETVRRLVDDGFGELDQAPA
ncbi:PTS-dependent dihydroxyacetone kinase, phosphotransferase subunit DhaM [Microbacterium laevaniformans]|uniref:Phosphocarrier protein HPr n=1 Tax=Microbacterium laevaniformans TaxID=36807 RepID=A0A150HF21_9MICO|nr:HPr family phosphocarrier protein [Microbacterium laevaniformans]KXZ60729.1 PTS-dependent dihydroxyacetone kinase, phosphotransferase subunit DhaM [Microbacterium laevaniformans]